MKKLLFVTLLLIFNIDIVNANDLNMNNEIVYKSRLVEELKKEIIQIDSESARCSKAKKAWKTATIIGGVGVVATGTAALVQAAKIRAKKSNNASKQEPSNDE